MEETGLHPGLEIRLTALATRIAELRRKMTGAKGPEKIEELGKIEELERRHKVLADRLQKLNDEGPGFRQDTKADIEKVADDLTGRCRGFHDVDRFRLPARSAPEATEQILESMCCLIAPGEGAGSHSASAHSVARVGSRH
jgi:hypothetical protein